MLTISQLAIRPDCFAGGQHDDVIGINKRPPQADAHYDIRCQSPLITPTVYLYISANSTI